MRNIIGLLFIMLASSNAFASKARQDALQFGTFWVDTQTVFAYPQYVSKLGQYLTMEFGATGTFSTTPRAEGGFYKKTGEGIMGLYLGHQDSLVNTFRAVTSSTEQQNPVNFFYAKGDMGFGVNFSFADLRTTNEKEFTLGGSFGTKCGSWDFGANATVYSRSAKGTAKVTTAPAVTLSANTDISDATKFYGNATVLIGESTATTNAETLTLGIQDQSIKMDGGFFFYGIQTTGGIAKGGALSVSLPVYGGIETDLSSWATLRGSLSQNLLVGISKASTAAVTDFNTNNTKVSVGGTLKHGNFNLDGLLAAGTTGQVNGSSFLTSASLTYKF